MASTTNMTEGRPIKLILAFALPLFIGNIFQQIYNVADTAIAGYALGDSAIAAIGATSSLYSLIINLAWGMNSGFGIIISRHFGAGDRQSLQRAIGTSMLLNLAIGVGLTALSLACLNPLLPAMNVPRSILPMTRQYIATILAGMPATIAYNMLAGLLRAMGNSRTPLVFLIFSCLLDGGLNALFVIVFGWGVFGAAISTVIAQGCSAAACAVYVLKYYKEYLPRRRHFTLNGHIVRDLLGMGASMAAMLCVVDLGSVIYQRSINDLGENYITAQTAARRIITLFMMPLGSLSTANSTFAGQNWGAGDYGRIKRGLTGVLAMEVVYSLAACAIVFPLAELLVVSMTNTHNGGVISDAVFNIRCHFVCYPALGILLALRTTLQATGHKIFPTLSSLFELAIKVLAGVWSIPAFGYISVCFAEPVIWVVCMVLLIIVFAVLRPFKIALHREVTDEN